MNCPSQNLLKTPVCWGVCFVWVSQAQTLLSAMSQGCANNMPDLALWKDTFTLISAPFPQWMFISFWVFFFFQPSPGHQLPTSQVLKCEVLMPAAPREAVGKQSLQSLRGLVQSKQSCCQAANCGSFPTSCFHTLRIKIQPFAESSLVPCSSGRTLICYHLPQSMAGCLTVFSITF